MIRLASLFAVAGLTLAAMTLASSPKAVSRKPRRREVPKTALHPRRMLSQVLEPVVPFHARFSLN